MSNTRIIVKKDKNEDEKKEAEEEDILLFEVKLLFARKLDSKKNDGWFTFVSLF